GLDEKIALLGAVDVLTCLACGAGAATGMGHHNDAVAHFEPVGLRCVHNNPDGLMAKLAGVLAFSPILPLRAHGSDKHLNFDDIDCGMRARALRHLGLWRTCCF